MISKGLGALRPRFAKKKLMGEENSTPRHPPTTHLWQAGDGGLPRRELRVMGWNVNGVRSVLRKNELRPLLAKWRPDWLCLNETKIDLETYGRELRGLHFG
jgi:hypothetical protein